MDSLEYFLRSSRHIGGLTRIVDQSLQSGFRLLRSTVGGPERVDAVTAWEDEVSGEPALRWPPPRRAVSDRWPVDEERVRLVAAHVGPFA
jgi:hypothetical protein